MKKLFIVSAFMFLAACGKKGGESAGDKIITEYGALKDKLCACADKECADKVKAESDALEERAGKEIGKPTKDQEARFEKIEDEVNACAKKFE